MELSCVHQHTICYSTIPMSVWPNRKIIFHSKPVAMCQKEAMQGGDSSTSFLPYLFTLPPTLCQWGPTGSWTTNCHTEKMSSVSHCSDFSGSCKKGQKQAGHQQPPTDNEAGQYGGSLSSVFAKLITVGPEGSWPSTFTQMCALHIKKMN